MNIKFGIYALIILGVLNLIILDAALLLKDDSRKIEIPNITLKETPTPTPFVQNICPQSCIEKISEATSSIKLSTPKPAIQTTSPVSKESYVALGSGSTSAGDWTDLSGSFEYVDSTKYGRIKTVTFEASVRIPTGNQTAYVRLFNATDKHPVWFSEVSMEGGTPRDLVSQPITLDSGVKLYQVQMKTSLKYTAILDKASVHIVSF